MTDTIGTKVQKILAEFNALPDWEAKYSRIIELGRSLPAMPEGLKTEENRVRGCQSQVWLSAEIKDGTVRFIGDSDAAIVKGLVALLLEVYSGQSPQEILKQSPDFLQQLGLLNNLSQTRASGLVSMIKQIKFYALAFQTKAV